MDCNLLCGSPEIVGGQVNIIASVGLQLSDDHLLNVHLCVFVFSAEKFVVVSYNILGVENASKHSDMYDNIPPKYMKWKRRKRLIRKEINRYNASIVCFQV